MHHVFVGDCRQVVDAHVVLGRQRRQVRAELDRDPGSRVPDRPGQGRRPQSRGLSRSRMLRVVDFVRHVERPDGGVTRKCQSTGAGKQCLRPEDDRV